jgi:hypothetical protein
VGVHNKNKTGDARCTEANKSPSSSRKHGTEKLSSSIDPEIMARLRRLAHTHRFSESSIVEVALTMFFARGDDVVLAAVLRELGATLRRR